MKRSTTIKNRVVFLDRDGTVIRGIPRPEFCLYATSPWFINEIQFEPHLREAIKIFKDLGYLVIMITNQPDVACGHISRRRWREIFEIILKEVRPHDYYYCPHRKSDNCDCKKPKPGMLLQAAQEQEWDINLKKSFMIGDTNNDVLAGKAAGCKTIIINRLYNQDVAADFRVPSLLAATSVV